jgi:4-hydroxy-tetrahydrodipicolinate reductase
MYIILIGHGAMGRLIHSLVEEKGHEIVTIIDDADSGLSAGELAEKLTGGDVAIDFSTAEAVVRNVEACMLAGIPIVVGTTGWHDQKAEIERFVKKGGGAMVYGANFSIGVNLFYRIADYAAELLSRFPEYEAFIEEQHHSRKKDSPSGTALKLKDVVETHISVGDIAATRAGNIPGTHRLGFDGPADQILLEHAARNRECFAAGAIMAAEWIEKKKGFFEFSACMDEKLGDC